MGNRDTRSSPHDRRGERGSAMVAGAALIAFVVGVFLWGSLALSAVSFVSGVIDELGIDSSASPLLADDADVLDCDEPPPPGRIAAYAEQCPTPTPVPEPTPEPEPTPDTRLNREDCEEIRGTDYHSPEERAWFLANCVTN